MPILYNGLFKAENYLNSPKPVLNMFCAFLGIYLICIGLEIFRIILFKPLDDKVERIKFELNVINDWI